MYLLKSTDSLDRWLTDRETHRWIRCFSSYFVYYFDCLKKKIKDKNKRLTDTKIKKEFVVFSRLTLMQKKEKVFLCCMRQKYMNQNYIDESLRFKLLFKIDDCFSNR